jgi:two-component system, NarL family, nitrate/nitrite response regulator NarL
MATLVTVVVVDDHPFFRDGVARGLTQSGRIKVLGEAEDGRQALEVIAREQPEVALVDYQMPDMDGIAVVRALKRDDSPTRVLLLSALTDSAIVFQALEEGASGYLAKDSSRAEIVDAVIRVAKGDTVVPPSLTVGLVEQIRLRSQPDALVLSERERQIVQGFARGLSIPQLAEELFIGTSTVKTYAQRLYEKLGVSDRAAAVAEAMRRGLLE